MSEFAEKVCYNCGMGTDLDPLRPYGPGGVWVCYTCATDTPEHQAITEAVFMALAEAARAMSPTGTVVIGDGNGPQPVLDGDLDESV